jgi:hypothetical protein
MPRFRLAGFLDSQVPKAGDPGTCSFGRDALGPPANLDLVGVVLAYPVFDKFADLGR